MATVRVVKAKKGKIETDVERYRAEGHWNKALDLLINHVSDRSTSLHLLNQLIVCENELEWNDQGELRAENLSKAKSYAEEVINGNDEQYKYEASVLLGKIYYLQGNNEKALKLLNSLNLLSAKMDPITLRFNRILSEGLAILGLCKEEQYKLKGSPELPKEKDAIIALFNLACHLCIRHLQELDRNQSEHTSLSVTLPPIVEKVIQRIPQILIEKGDISGAISKYRTILGYCELPATKSLRQALSLQFAELLLRSVCVKAYHKYDISQDQDPQVDKDSQLIPYRYPTNRYIPDNRIEEAVFSLMISEHIASQDVILNRPSELSEPQIVRSFNNAAAVYDLLAVLLTKVRHFKFLSKCLEKALKFSYRQFHIWYQFALSLISSKQYYRGYLALRECLRIDDSKISVYLLTSSLCLGHLNLIEEGMELASRAVEVASQSEAALLARAHLLVGWGWSILARSCCVMDKKSELRNRAIKEYRIAVQLDPDDYLAWYHLAVELATQRHLDEALSVCQQSLQLMPIHSNTLYLLALLHTAGGKRLDQASKALYVGLTDRPNDFNLLFLLAKIEEARINPKAGLKIYRQLLKVWRNTFSLSTDSKVIFDRTRKSALSSNNNDTVNSNINDNLTFSNTASFSPTLELDDDCSILHLCEEKTANCSNHLQSALSDIALGCAGQTGASIIPIPRQSRSSTQFQSIALKMQIKIYQGLAESYLDNDQLFEAKDALDEVMKIGGLDNQTLYLRGRLAEKRGLLCIARSLYESVIALKPDHLQALLSLANLLHKNNQTTLAERVARDAMNVDPTNFRVWRLLSDILGSSNSPEPASETVVTRALLTAIELEQTEPIEPFYCLPLGIRCS
ncbi:Tetratricopeptide repeat protein [Schistosoma japonicum]|uniref:Tetratricopeptide repeat protein n=1 Tax=Schistosoma japonicum TaxID=6182 RepID=A0A4Z2DND2_SCHJA|nr:Tetratricopeptide repeat protein [Schistosoma japonicum]